MTTYHEWAEKKGRRPSTASAAFDVVEIDGMLVTEGEQPDGSYMFTLPPDSHAQKMLDRLSQGDVSPRDRESANDRHGWHCPCIACRIDRGED